MPAVGQGEEENEKEGGEKTLLMMVQAIPYI